MDTTLDFNDAVAAELRRQRASQGLTIDEVARRAGMVRTTVLRYLNGKRAIPIAALYGLSAALCVEAHRVVAAAEASCAAMYSAGDLSAVSTTDSTKPEVRTGQFLRERSQVGASARDHARITPTLTGRSTSAVVTARGDRPDRVGTAPVPARVAISGDTGRRVGPHCGAPSAARNLIA